MSVTAGPYSATWNALALGETLQGFDKSYSMGARPIQFDSVGETPVDMLTNRLILTVDFILAEYDAAAVATLTWPWHATRGSFPKSGTSLFSLAKPLVLTACGTVTNPATITFYKAILAPDFQERLRYSHMERYIPVQMYVFPIKAGSSASPVIPSGCNELLYFAETAQV